jgi:hypothetical protein
MIKGNHEALQQEGTLEGIQLNNRHPESRMTQVTQHVNGNIGTRGQISDSQCTASHLSIH